jgi:hypothetical protein
MGHKEPVFTKITELMFSGTNCLIVRTKWNKRIDPGQIAELLNVTAECV